MGNRNVLALWRKVGDWNWKTIGTVTTAALLGGTLIRLSFLIYEKPQDKYLNLVCLVLAVAIGWVLGIMSAPYTKAERDQFVIYTKAASVFVSGFVLGKANDLIGLVLSPAFIFKPTVEFRVMAFISAVLITTIITRTFRVYW